MKLIIIFTLLSFSAFAKEGRYQFHMNQSDPGKSVLLDTASGKVYTRSCIAMVKSNGECVGTVWTEEMIRGVSSENAIKEHMRYWQNFADNFDKEK